MESMASLSGAGTGLSQVNFQAQWQVGALQKEETVMKDLGTAALRLIQGALVTDPAIGQNLDVNA